MPLISQPPPTGVAEPVGAATAAHRKSPVAEELGLGVLLEQRADLQRVRRGETEAPGGRRAAARDRHDDPQEGGEVDLVPAVAPRARGMR